VIQFPHPAVDGGRYPAKRCVGDVVDVGADVFRDGHELIRAVIRYRGPGDEDWQEVGMRRIDAHLGGVRWAGQFTVDRAGSWQYTIEAWTDVFGTWRDELQRKVNAHQHDLSGELSEGRVLLEAAAERARDPAGRQLMEHAVQQLSDPDVPESAQHDVALGEELALAVEHEQERHGNVTLDQPLTIEVDRLRARFGAWYEMFPRSWGGLRGVEAQLPRLAELGFDIIYLPPIHPIGLTNRKGRDNAIRAHPGRSATRAAATTPSTPTWAPRMTCARSPPPPRGSGSTSRWTSPCSAPPTTHGSPSTPSGFTAGPTAR
jgi:starch synthase (maltosyl-transferring)